MNDTEWFAEHTAYLATPEWAFRRGQVLNRDGYRCQARMPGCRTDATQVHHLSYKHWRNEPLFELVSVCPACHEQITEMDRANRPPEARLREPHDMTSRVVPWAPPQPEFVSYVKQIAELLETSGPWSERDLANYLRTTLLNVQTVLRRHPERFVRDPESQEWTLIKVGMDLLVPWKGL